MIYMKNGKLLVKDGKLCSTCCPELPTFCACSLNNYCPLCFPVNQTPTKLGVIFDGIRLCSDDSLHPINGEIICMTQDIPCAGLHEMSYAWTTLDEEAVDGYYATYLVYYIPDEQTRTWLTLAYEDDCRKGGAGNYFVDDPPINCVTAFECQGKVIRQAGGYPTYGGIGTIINVCQISVMGTLTPNATCNYEVFNLHNERPCYHRITTEDYFIWWDGIDSWIISSTLGVVGTAYWKRTNLEMFGTYTQQGTATGTATVAQGTHA